MKKTLNVLLGLIMILYSCSSEKTYKIRTEHDSNIDNIRIINEILKDTKGQIPYIDNSFYIFQSDDLKHIDINKEDYDFILNHKKVLDSVDYTFAEGDIKFYDTISNQIKNSRIIKSKEEGYNKEIIQISRPYKLTDNKVIIFYYGTIIYFMNNKAGPIVGGIWAVKYKRTNGNWAIEKSYPIADIS